MRQVITRVEDDLHTRLKEQAAARGLSVNAFVVEVLTAAVGQLDRREVLRRRAEAAGRLVVPPPPSRVPSRKQALVAGRGAGHAVSEALAADRTER